MKKLILALGLLLILLINSTANPQYLYATQEHSSTRHPQSGFRYIIFYSGLLHGRRVTLVLMDRQAFSEANLKELFKLISKRFLQPDQLFVSVYTSLDQLPTPEEQDDEDSNDFWQSPERQQTFNKYPRADYVRENGNESFHYVMGGNDQTERAVIIKGQDLVERILH